MNDKTIAYILENVPAMIAFHDTEQNIVWGNRDYRDACGIDADQLAGKKCWIAWGLSKPCQNCPVKVALNTGKSAEAVITREGQGHWPENQGAWHVRATPATDDQGNIIGAIALAFEITKRKSREKIRLEEAQDRFRAIAENALDAIVLIDEEGKVVYWNPAAEKMFGYHAAEVMGKDVHAVLMPEEYQERFKKGFEEFRKTGKGPAVGKVLELTAKLKPGTKIPIEISVAPIRIGENVWVCAIIRDISARKRLIEDLQQTRDLLQAVLDNIPLMIKMYDPDGRILLLNKTFENLIGWSKEEAEKVDLMQEIYPDPAYRQKAWKFMRSTAREWREFSIKTKNGDIVESVWTNIRLPDGNQIGIGMDIRDLLAKDNALKESQKRFDLLVSRLNDVIWSAKMNGSIIEANHAFETVYGISEEDLKRNPGLWLEVVHPEDRRIAEDSARQLRNTGLAEAEYRIVRPDGEVRWIRDRKSLIYNEKGQPKQMGGIINDITELKKKEEEKERLQKQLIQAQKMEAVGRLAGGVAHDFNNMLSIILGFTQLAMMRLERSDPIYAELEEIYRAGERSASLTRQLLAFARQQTIIPEVLDLNACVAEMLKMLQRLIGEDIEIAWKPGTNVWPVKMDPSQVDQILANLAVNARDAIKSVGKLTLETENVVIDEKYCARYSYSKPGEFVMLAVSDSGCGMDQGTLERIFEPFFTTKGQNGTGLGLATVYGIVKQNHGFINVYSEPGQGTTFKIYLPRFAGTIRGKTAEQHQDLPRGKGETVLVVEDEPQILNFCKKTLEYLGYRVIEATNPMEAITLAEKHSGKIDLLLTDVIMPEMNGRELATQIHSINPNIKPIFMSGYTSNVIAHHGVLDEGIVFVQKPLELNNLAKKIRKALTQK